MLRNKEEDVNNLWILKQQVLVSARLKGIKPYKWQVGKFRGLLISS